MSRKYIRRFIRYHPSLLQDKKIICLMDQYDNNISLKHLSRVVVRYRKARSSDYFVLQLKDAVYSLEIDFSEILALNRAKIFSCHW